MNGVVAANNLKTVLLLGGLMGLFVVVGSLWGAEGMILGLVFGGLMNLSAWWFSDTIAIKSMRGQEVTREQGGWLYEMVEELAINAGLPMPRVYICPHAAPNAFATGRSPKKAAVAFTQGLLQTMSREEIRGVAAHELAHIKNRDTLTSTIAATVSGVLAFLAQWGLLLGGGRREGGNPLVMFAVVILAALGAALIKAMISRSREFVADADGARIAGSPDGLISALGKLDAMSRRIPLNQPNPAMNNLFIIEPLASNLGGGSTLINLFATHPPTEKRIASLRSLRI
ncbi:MAG: protease HtpX [Planctomycetota bacterium]|nr:MAG: protease HtpX [Planctomycetota bacterium]